MIRNTLFAIVALSLSGCGAVYFSSQVSEKDGKVRVMPITGETVLVANKSSYSPKTLPAAFFQGAGGATGVRGVGALPTPPLEEERRPSGLERRVPPPVADGAYTIGIGDVLTLATPSAGDTVAELSGLLAAQSRRQGYTVQDDGAISIPDVGRITVLGMTLEEAEAEVFQKLVENQVDPSFSLEISEFRSKRVSVGGAVRNPSIQPIALTPLTLEEAIVAAGGIATRDVDFASIRIYRDGTIYQIPLVDFRTRPALQKTRLAPGDSVFVDTEYELDRAQAYFEQQIRVKQLRAAARSQALSELQLEVGQRRAVLQEQRSNFREQVAFGAVSRDYVYLTGEVTKPSRFVLPFNQKSTLADALFESGGFSAQTANPAQIYVLRGSANPAEFGAVTAWNLDGRMATNFVLATKFELRPNDVIFVSEQPVTRWQRVIQQITPSLFFSAASTVSN